MLIPNELVLSFWGFYGCANFGENRSRNATVRVLADGHTYTRTLTRTQIGFIICPVLYAIAMGQIINTEGVNECTECSHLGLCIPRCCVHGAGLFATSTAYLPISLDTNNFNS